MAQLGGDLWPASSLYRAKSLAVFSGRRMGRPTLAGFQPSGRSASNVQR